MLKDRPEMFAGVDVGPDKARRAGHGAAYRIFLDRHDQQRAQRAAMSDFS